MQNTITQHLLKDHVLRPLVQNIPFPEFSTSKGVYLDLLRSIVGQQLSGKAAATIHSRFLDLFHNQNPQPGELQNLGLETLRTAGLSRQKAAYLQNVAAFFENENVSEDKLRAMPDDKVIQYLTQIKGVGKWTVEMILMFTLQRPDVLPVDDLGIQNAIAGLYGIEEKGKALKEKMVEIATPWQPYRSYACYLLWRYKDGG
ncbi:MAG: DNA-3-methyladenine glycosylase 2 family protein [Saprospiraceae bacterium]|nr:MAG: DNA-3-methyladenine glycosylase 2 family protein [Saprospiraceae bacterium]